jgi:hypothetical protein
MSRAATSPISDASAFERESGHAPTSERRFGLWLRRIVSEPFVHFALLGALLFAGHRLLAPVLDAPVIEISAAKQREITKLFEQRQRRPPNDAERAEMFQRHAEDEVLFREGLRLSLVHTDPILRAQMIARVRGMLQAELEQKAPTELELRRHYDAHRASYTGPEGASEPSFETVRERVATDYRKQRTSRAFQAEVRRLTSQWDVQIAEQP